MQIATITLALAGDPANTIQKLDATPSEVAVLQRIHGLDAVFDITVTGEVARSNRQERERLTEAYGKMTVDGQYESPAVNSLFPGAAARLFEAFDELELDESLFVATRPKAEAPVEPAAPVAAPKRSKKAAAEPAPAPAPVAEPDEDDGIEEMPDAGLFGEK